MYHCIFFAICFFPLNIISGRFVYIDLYTCSSFILTPVKSSLYDYSIVYLFINWLIALTKEIWAISSVGFCCCFVAVVDIYVSWFAFVETGCMVLCESLGFGLCASLTLLNISALLSYQQCINIAAMQQSL